MVMETKCGNKKKSTSRNSTQFEAPLGYIIEDVRPNGGIHKFRSAAYSNVRPNKKKEPFFFLVPFVFLFYTDSDLSFFLFAAREEAILTFLDFLETIFIFIYIYIWMLQ